MFATYLTLAQEACEAVKAHKERLVDQVAHILADGVKQGAFQVADVKSTARAMFDATTRYHHPAHSDEWKDPATRGADRRAAGAVAQGPGSAAQALDPLSILSRIARVHCLISITPAMPGAIMGAEETVRLAIFADIHANRQAFAACLEAARGAGRGADRLPRRHRRLWRRSGMGGRHGDGSRRDRRDRRARQPRQRHRHPLREHERRSAGRDRMDPRPARAPRSGGSSPSCR